MKSTVLNLCFAVANSFRRTSSSRAPPHDYEPFLREHAPLGHSSSPSCFSHTYPHSMIGFQPFHTSCIWIAQSLHNPSLFPPSPLPS